MNCTETGLRETVLEPEWPPRKQVDPWGDEELVEDEEFWVDLASKAARDRTIKREAIDIPAGNLIEKASSLVKEQGKNLVVKKQT